jgi:putative transposase
MIAFIDDHRGEFGAEPICRVLPIAPSTYYARAAIARNPDLASDRAKQDAKDLADIKSVYAKSKGRYGARKVWHQLRRDKKDIARCTVERLMREHGLQGVTRGKKRTTIPDPAQACPDDKVNREFTATAPNQLWVSDFTYVSTLMGMVYVAFVIDVFARKIVGWRVSTSMTTSFVLDALNQAICQRCPPQGSGLIHHSDRGSQGGFNRSSQHRPSYPVLAIGREPLPAFASPAFFGGACSVHGQRRLALRRHVG